MTRDAPILRTALAVLLVTALVASCSQWGEQEVSLEHSAQSPTSTSPAPLGQGEHEGSPQLEWTDCDGDLECATLDVPLDHDDPDGDTLEIALARRPARDPENRIGSVVVNPGGPGASGVDMVSYLRLPGELTDRFDVVGFDPRGVGASSPIDCHTHLQAIYDADPTMEDPADVAHFLEVSQAFVDECEADHADVLPHLGTENVARDLDVIRGALGDAGLTYVGYSYGTSIGQQYARLHPERVRAMVLDGVVDVTATGIEAAEAQAIGFTRALDAYIARCDAASCLEQPAGQVIDAVTALAEAQPLPAPGADRSATPGVIALALARALYAEQLWPQLSRALGDAMEGDGTALVQLADDYLDRRSDGSYSNAFEVYFGVSCLDAEWPDTYQEVLAEAKEVGARYPRIGEALVNDYARCALWPATGDPLEPIPTDIDGLAPIVLVSTTGDPATPHEAAVEVAGSIPDARLITHVGEGHTIFGSGKPCIDDAVVDYLVELDPPDDGLRCE